MNRVRTGLLLVVIAGAGALAGRHLFAPGPPDVPASIQTADALEVVFFDVGGGDAAVLISPGPDRKVVLIDGGNGKAGLVFVSTFLESRGIRAIDLVVLSHPDPDHLGGILVITRELVVREVWDPGFEVERDGYPLFRETMRRELGDHYRAPFLDWFSLGEPIRFGPLEIVPLSSHGAIANPGPAYGSNAASLVLRIGFGENSILFTGDATPETEAALLTLESRRPGILESTVIKVPHHGSGRSSTRALIEAVRPDWAVISSGGMQPGNAALARYCDARVNIVRTDAGDPRITKGDDNVHLLVGRAAGDLTWSQVDFDRLIGGTGR